LEDEWGTVHVVQRTWLLDELGQIRQPLHLEAGIVVPRDEGSFEYGCGQDSCRIESMSGTPVVSSNWHRRDRLDNHGPRQPSTPRQDGS